MKCVAEIVGWKGNVLSKIKADGKLKNFCKAMFIVMCILKSPVRPILVERERREEYINK